MSEKGQKILERCVNYVGKLMVEAWKNDAQILERSINDGRIFESWVDLRA